jgi:hypothetical protein
VHLTHASYQTILRESQLAQGKSETRTRSTMSERKFAGGQLNRADHPALNRTSSPEKISSSNTDAANAQARRRPARQVTLPNDERDPPSRSTGESRRSSGRRGDSMGSRREGEPVPGILRRMTTGLLTPERKVGKAPTWIASFRAAILSSWM